MAHAWSSIDRQMIMDEIQLQSKEKRETDLTEFFANSCTVTG